VDLPQMTQGQLEKHEAECAIRYQYVQDSLKSLDKRMWRMEAMIMCSTLAVIGTAVALLVNL
jgi:hypothetical protein|tara:strand:+ start:10703 stop:10888 length:186 start_codon:yes stop_codon:yes gene_type:complete